MKHLLGLILVVILCFACSSFQLDKKCEEAKTETKDTSLQDLIEESLPSKKEIAKFQKRTSQQYQAIISNNKEIVKTVCDNSVDEYSSNWQVEYVEVERFLYNKFKDKLNPQKDAQEYINLMLKLVVGINDDLTAIVLENADSSLQYPGRYIFFSRKEIECFESERELMNSMLFKLVENSQLNKVYGQSRKRFMNIEWAIEDSQRQVYNLDSKKIPDQVEYTHDTTIDNWMVLCGYKAFANADKYEGAIFFKDKYRHKKVFD